MTSFVNDTKIEHVNTKFATSILKEAITRLTLFQCAEIAENQRDEEITTSNRTKNNEIKLMKFANDVNNSKLLLRQVISDLERHQSFADFSGVTVARNESNFLTEYDLNKTKLQQQCVALRKLEQEIASYHPPTSTVDESIIKCRMQNRFIKTWEKARRDQNEHFERMLIGRLQNEIDKYSSRIESEKDCILQIENYREMEMHKEESQRWSEKFDIDLNKTEMDIQVAMVDLEAMKRNYENTVESIKFRCQEMKDFVALKEERSLQKDSDLMKLIYKQKDHLFAKCKISSELL